MNSPLSVRLYRYLAQAYPSEFRSQFGASMDQVFADMLREGHEKYGFVGRVLVWFSVLPDFLFSVTELMARKTGDFLKWRLRLHWVLACSLGFALARCVALIVGREFYLELEARGTAGIVLGRALQMTILMTSIGAMQSWVLAGRCFRKKQWVLYALAGAALAAVVLQPLVVVAAPGQAALVRWIQQTLNGPIRDLGATLVTSAPIWMIVGALTGLLQATAIRSDAISRYRWMLACAVGYFLSAIAGGFAIPYSPGSPQPSEAVLQLIFTSVVSGALLGLVSSRALEQVLFNVQADSTK